MTVVNLPQSAVHRDITTMPEYYRAAVAALAQCARVDECKDWADKSRAIAIYAAQMHDPTLRDYAQRIFLRAYRRLGELLLENPVENHGPKTLLVDKKGLTRNERQTAREIARVPEREFVRAVESSPAPTLVSLRDHRESAARKAGRSTSPGVTELIRTLDGMMTLTANMRARFMWTQADDAQRKILTRQMRAVGAWLAQLRKAMRE